MQGGGGSCVCCLSYPVSCSSCHSCPMCFYPLFVVCLHAWSLSLIPRPNVVGPPLVSIVVHLAPCMWCAPCHPGPGPGPCTPPSTLQAVACSGGGGCWVVVLAVVPMPAIPVVPSPLSLVLPVSTP
jgi:hypothetical protein